ncbi:MAG TPA: hypothetical protein VIU65_01815 [Pyrinomonadaceae bacterium]
MLRRFTFVLLFVACCLLFGCQNYSSGLVQSAARADEAVVFSNLRSIMKAQQAYNISTGSYGTFTQLTDGAYLDSRFKGEQPVLNEYQFTITVKDKGPDNPLGSYSVNADPARSGDRAGRHFYTDSNSSEIHVNNTQAATASDEVISP